MLTNREWATLLWLAVLIVFMLWKRDIRNSVAGVVAAFLQPKLLVPLLVFIVWMVGVVWVAAQLGAWQSSMVKDTIFWTVPALVLFFASTKAASEERFFRRRLLNAVGLTVLLEFYLNLATLDLVWEVLLQPVIFFAVAISTLAEGKKETQPVKRLADVVLAVLVIGLLVPPTAQLISDAGTIDAAETLLDLALPVWLTVGALPFIYALSLYSSYELAFVHMRLGSPDGRVPWRARLALVASFHFRHRAVHAFAGNWPRELVRAQSLREARRIIAAQQAALRAEEVAKKKEAEDLVRYAGVEGTDAEGHQLDRREFKETTDSLELLSVSQMGWYRQGNRYRRALLDQLGSALLRGLPEDHGITLKVSRSGQSWFAWRRTPSGWCFAIGSAGPPPNQWYYDGPVVLRRPRTARGIPGHPPLLGRRTL